MMNETKKIKPYCGNDDIIKAWVDKFLNSNRTIAEEKAEVLGSISNERLWEKGADTKEQTEMHAENVHRLLSYLNWLEDNE